MPIVILTFKLNLKKLYVIIQIKYLNEINIYCCLNMILYIVKYLSIYIDKSKLKIVKVSIKLIILLTSYIQKHILNKFERFTFINLLKKNLPGP